MDTNAAKGLLLGIDIGTTATKAALFTTSGKLVGTGRSGYLTSYSKPGYAEQNPEDWWRAVCESIKIARNGNEKQKILGVSVSSQAPTLIPIDSSGQVLRPAMIWMDRRAESQARQLKKFAPDVLTITGNRSDPFYVASKIMWLKENEPEIFAATKMFLQINGYINYRLTGEFGMDPAHASLLQLRDKNQRWDATLIKFVGIENDKLPKIGESASQLGVVSKLASIESSLESGTPVFYGTVDGAAAALEVGAIDPGTVVEMTGTSSVILMPTDGSIIEQSFTSMAAAIPHRELLLAAMVSSGASLEWMHKTLFAGVGNLEQLITEAEGIDTRKEGVIFLPYMMGERSPIWNSNARGVLFGLNLATSRASITRAVLEGTAFAFAQNIEIARKAGVQISEIRTTGGGAKSDLWVQIKSDITGIPINVPEMAFGATFGDALIVGMGLGIYNDIRATLNESVKIAKIYTPDPSKYDFYQAKFQEYLKLYENSKSSFDTLSQLIDSEVAK